MWNIVHFRLSAPTLVQARPGTTIATMASTTPTAVRLGAPRMRQKSPISVGQAVKVLGSQPGQQPQIISIATPKTQVQGSVGCCRYIKVLVCAINPRCL